MCGSLSLSLSVRLAEISHSAAEGAAAPPGTGFSGQPAGRDHPRHRRQGERVSVCRDGALSSAGRGGMHRPGFNRELPCWRVVAGRWRRTRVWSTVWRWGDKNTANRTSVSYSEDTTPTARAETLKPSFIFSVIQHKFPILISDFILLENVHCEVLIF